MGRREHINSINNMLAVLMTSRRKGKTYRKSRKWLPVHILLVCLFPRGVRGVRGVIGVIILCLSLVVSLFRC